ncbi:MAG: hypothetical protein LM586_04685 [Desulfurococcales archaeon]|jgi:hypothetical protein|nr:hypothetical protein [Desulfurococcales archaeon]
MRSNDPYDGSDDRFRKIFEKCDFNIYGLEICLYIYEDTRSRRKRFLLYMIDETFGEKIFVKKFVSEQELMNITGIINRMRLPEAVKRIFT